MLTKASWKGRVRLGAIAGFVSCAWTTVVIAGDVATCNGARGEAGIRACGRLLAQGGDGERMGLAHFKRGLAYSRGGEHRRALADFTAAARLMPGDADAAQNVAATRMRLGDEQGAREELRRQARWGLNVERAERGLRALDALNKIDAEIARERHELELRSPAAQQAARSRR